MKQGNKVPLRKRRFCINPFHSWLALKPHHDNFQNNIFGKFHYLLKPVEEKKFSEVFERAKKEVEKRTTRGQKNIFIKTRNRSFTINHDNILYIENRGKKVEIHTSNEIIETYASMNDLEKQLGGNFYRCHRGYLVNMAHIAEYENDSISLSNGENIFMAKERYNEFVKEYMRYLRNGGTACV